MKSISRRNWMALAGTAAASLPLAAAALETKPVGAKEYTLLPLPYPADALEPYLDAKTLTIHHDKHHAGYVKGLNSTLARLSEARDKNDLGQIQKLCRALAFHGSGHVLHTLYFANLSPKPMQPGGALLEAVKAQYGSLDMLKAELVAASATVSGSGWGVLAYEPLGGRLLTLQVEKHENQLLAGAVPLLAIDVWEHAYYLKYQNRRMEYLDAVMKVVDWSKVAKRFQMAVK